VTVPSGTALSRLEEILTRSDVDGRLVSMNVPDTCDAITFTAEDDRTGLTAGSAIVAMPVLLSLSQEALIDFVFEELADALKDSEELGGRTIYILQ
jgi:hypothetical protein